MHITLVHDPASSRKPLTLSLPPPRANHEASIQEDGNRRFDVLQSPDDPARFILTKPTPRPTMPPRTRQRHTTSRGATRSPS